MARTVRQLGGEAVVDWATEGLRCSFTIPAGGFQAPPAAEGAAVRMSGVPASPAPVA
jgi:hypothetical protein